MRSVAATTRPGLYGEDGGLDLRVGATDGKSWSFRFQLNLRPRQMGLGPVDPVSLAEAREPARDARRLLLNGIDPIEDRRAKRQAVRIADAKTVTFRDAATRYVASHEAGWRNEKHRRQSTSSLETYACPVLGELPMTAIDTALVMQCSTRSGGPSRRPPGGSAAGSRRSCRGRRCAATARARTRHG